VLVQLRDARDPETGHRHTVKRYESEKVEAGQSWRHTEIFLKPRNSLYAPVVLENARAGDVQVIAEVIEVLGSSPPSP